MTKKTIKKKGQEFPSWAIKIATAKVSCENLQQPFVAISYEDLREICEWVKDNLCKKKL